MTDSFDLINGCFELFGGVLLYQNVRQLYTDKEVRGVHWTPTLFFTLWGIWNLRYYSHLDQWLSLCGGILLAIMNLTWLGQILYYKGYLCTWKKKLKRS